ncbi:MAG TPA: 16S rRNA (cytidine(1402)-2'-O)-methyltransferase [Oligoflexus sp.]|uniref:16S rRNA (cytidine(1402)-2'-O)-methyltransferase n=1 Tax=Oligoflexus sp. TaxID=1971216 RepID=UPI002D32A494|nr:16S rRNA (cytidine(1402)-2'-O)-methyltransferase [Oligoflexus sp.]HYX36087.1 16S rRNA (cytidine(1402)-2'-O)-methyltransferase [Oligoflexus sp.]
MTEASSSIAIYVVATPIGNLDDISQRAMRILKNVDLIAAEDTRRARQLLQQIGREKVELISYYDHVEQEKTPQILDRLQRDNLSLALVSDAGTPCISDPGYRLIREAKKRGIPVHPIPGPSALTALVSASGLPSDRLLFVGFLPNKKAALMREVASWRGMRASIVFYEAPRRLDQVFKVIEELYPNAELVVGRELTKLHEEILSTDIQGARSWCHDHEFLKGEATVMVSLGKDAETPEVQAAEAASEISGEAIQLFKAGATLKDLLQKFRDRGLSRSDLYQLLLEAKEASDDT